MAVHRRAADGDDAFFPSLANHPHDPQVKVQVLHCNLGQFRGAQATGIKQLDNCAVAQRVAVFAVDGGEEFFDLIAA